MSESRGKHSPAKRDEMAMADERSVSEIVTAFLLDSCRLPPCPTLNNVQAAIACGLMATENLPNYKEAELIPLTTGSAAEFYIEPMLPYVGDIDVMYYWNILLAIPQGHPPPTQLPAEFHSYYVAVLEIIDSHLPGYVYLPARYLLMQRTDDGKYDYVEYDPIYYYKNKIIDRDEINKWNIHGPAFQPVRLLKFLLNNNEEPSLLSMDMVPCTRCLLWPPQAADWPTRHRNYDWPDSATRDRVVSNGCDLVGVAHRQCREHEWMGKHQHRLSFSRAEIILINNWMPVQQIAYHILRVYVKTERLTESVGNSEPAIMSNYHIKTLVLWACELKPRSWWTENLNLVRICAELLNTLSVWLSDTRCKHYFISSCNLLDTSLSDAAVTSKLMSIDETYLSTWLINNYIGRCAQLCPSYISRLFDDISTNVKLQKVVSEIVRWRLDTSQHDWWRAVVFAEMCIPRCTSTISLTARLCVYWTNELTKIDKRICLYFSAIALLYVARRATQNGFSDKLVEDILSTLLVPDCSTCYSLLSRCKTEQNTSELVEILQKSAVIHLTTYRKSVAPDFGSVITIVTTEFEALYAYKRGYYQRCLQLSTQNVHTLFMYSRYLHDVHMLPDLIQLFDDDIVSLTALMVMVNPKCRDEPCCTRISQLTLSLYLMTQCQLKLHHSVTSLEQILCYIKIAQRRIPHEATLDHLTLKLIECKAIPIVGDFTFWLISALARFYSASA